MVGANSYPEGVTALVTDSEQRLLVKWCQQLHDLHGNVGDVPYPEGTQPLVTDDEQRLTVKINALYAAIS